MFLADTELIRFMPQVAEISMLQPRCANIIGIANNGQHALVCYIHNLKENSIYAILVFLVTLSYCYAKSISSHVLLNGMFCSDVLVSLISIMSNSEISIEYHSEIITLE